MRKVCLAALVVVVLASPASAQSWANKLFKGGNPNAAVLHDFGVVARGEPQLEVKLEMTNIWKVPLTITRIHVSCGCVEATATKMTLQPNETAFFNIKMDGARFTGLKSVNVNVTVGPQFVSTAQLVVTANARQDVVLNPGEIDFGNIQRGSAVERSLEVECAGRPNWKLTKLVGGGLNSPFDLKYENLPPRVNNGAQVLGYRIIASLKPNAPTGPFRETVDILTTDPTQPKVPFIVAGTVLASVTASPSLVEPVGLKVGTSYKAPIAVSANQAFRIVGVQGNDADVKLVASPDQSDKNHFVELNITPKAAGPLNREFTLLTDMRNETVKVTVKGNVNPQGDAAHLARGVDRVPRGRYSDPMHKRGVPVSPGVVVARAFCVDDVLARREPHHLDAVAVSAELLRFDKAVHAVEGQLDAIIDRVTQQLGVDEAAIFRGHHLLLRDPALVGKVKSSILNKKIDARTALQDALVEYTELFSKIHDEYIKERLADIRDVVGRIIAQLEQNAAPPACLQSDEPMVLVAPEILPSQALWLEKFPIAGIITEMGGGTGHAAILARSLGIPLISGMVGVRRDVMTGDLIAMDGREGHIHVKPDAETEAAYRKLQREYANQREKLVENRDLPAQSPDGTELELLANVNGPADAAMAVRTGATGVGLYRTEYLFLTHPTVPTEEEQFIAYRSVIEASPNRKITIRTIDLGGDKLVPYVANQHETNPFMGWRSIRLTSAYPEFFLTQLRAIFRAALHGEVSLLFPMVSTFEEVRHIKKMVQQTKAQLVEEGIAFADNLPLGVMMEVPSAALCIDTILPEVDFISIGSNDLIQYVMAADRDNPRVAHLCEPFSPPVLRLLAHILRHCQRANKPVTLCGEMAARPRCVIALMGMGLRRFSMSPAFVPTIKEVVRTVTTDQARRVARKVLRLRTFRGVREYLSRVVKKFCPNVTFLDTKK